MSRRKSIRASVLRSSTATEDGQERKSARTLVACALISCALFCQGPVDGRADDSPEDSVLRIYLPREVTIRDNCLRLGQISIIRSNPGDSGLVAKASEIALGRISMPGQKIVVDRSTVLSRLACNGISASKVTLTGAEKVTVQKQQRIVKASEFVELASSFLKENPAAGSVCQADPIQTPKDLILPALTKDVRLSPHLVEGGATSQAKVQVEVLADGKAIGAGEVTFRLKYNGRTAVTLAEIPAGAVISPENVKIEKTVSDYPEPVNWSPPYGLIAKRRLPANTVIRPDMISLAHSTVIVKRNQTVVIRIEMPGLVVTALGNAIQEARAGECIKVRNTDSQRIILCTVNDDGTVEPVF